MATIAFKIVFLGAYTSIPLRLPPFKSVDEIPSLEASSVICVSFFMTFVVSGLSPSISFLETKQSHKGLGPARKEGMTRLPCHSL